ncbi:amino acid carrier protein [Echinicola sp. CAU 1574]|uniref:Amino acid carrier protein n=1 Tax=Echinicola arenosa TaxID=2774144 RepID=A0ABR9AT23_9BACT|nr:amino acid carrier protein [Echinicola arenosa]MBD8490759.1 amino acid carrier protein [Echinicola arenosa]
MLKYLFTCFFLFTLIPLSAQGLKVSLTTGNASTLINDGYMEASVQGGKPPYTYRWSNPSTPLDAAKATGLVEGVKYSLVVTDSEGKSQKVTGKVKSQSVTEHFNGAFSPLVEGLTTILFWDPFEAIGIYDPRSFAQNKEVEIPGWKAGMKDKFTLKQWLVQSGSHIKEGDPIAVILSQNQGELRVNAPATGILQPLVETGETIYNAENKEDLIETGAHVFAKVKYDNPVVLTHPNGDARTHPISFIVIWLVLGAIFFTIKMGFINIRGFKHAIQLASGKFNEDDAPGKITHFQAFATATSATVGLGNIAGVAIAISLGGAGATFWIIMAGFLGMSSKFVECLLGLKYRTIADNGNIFGGPMNYLRYGLEKRNLKSLGKFLAAFFAVLCVGFSFGGGNMFQANQSYEILSNQFPILEGLGFWVGVVLAILVGIVIIGGIDSIAKVTEKIVPFMAGLYIFGALVVILVNIGNIGQAFSAIWDGAFNPSALKGGFIGVLVIGFQRGVFSNEAGVGSAAIAHSPVKTNHPPSEGFVGLLEPFVDTIVVCTLTALVIIFTGKHEVEGLGGVALTSEAFASVISWFPYLLAVAVFLFAFSSMVSWSYYGLRAWTYLFGNSKKSELAYKLVFVIFVVVGASVSLGAVLDFSDMMILSMSFPNIIGLYIMSGEVRKDMQNYLKKLKKGELFSSQKNQDKVTA